MGFNAVSSRVREAECKICAAMNRLWYLSFSARRFRVWIKANGEGAMSWRRPLGEMRSKEA